MAVLNRQRDSAIAFTRIAFELLELPSQRVCQLDPATMDLEELLPDKKRSVKHIISNGQLKYIVLRAGRFTASSSLRESDEELGRVGTRSPPHHSIVC